MKRLMTGVLIAALLLSQTSIADVFVKTDAATVTAAEQDAEGRTISAFIELPDEIMAQNVPAGMALYELELPDTLEAIVVTDTEADADAGEGTDTDSDADVDTDTGIDIDADTNTGADEDGYVDASNDADTNADTYTDTNVAPDNDMLGDIDDAEGDTALLSGDGIMPIAEEHTHDDITFTAWTSTTSLPDSSGNYYLDTDVTVSSRLESTANITLCLNGHTITYDGLPIWVKSGGTLGIYDCQGNGTVVSDKSYCIRIDSGGTVDIYGGIFNSDNTQPAIYVEGTVTIENASVSGKNAVSIQRKGTANIYGGTFVSTSNPTISAVADASLKITGGRFIRDNGGNVIQNQGTLEMSGGTVTGKSTSTSGAVGIVNSGTSATATIKNVTVTTVGTVTDDDTADKGLRNDNGGTMTVENCKITSTNRAIWNTGGSTIIISGGTFNGRYGIYNNNGKFELSGSPIFAGSTADIYLSDDQKITVTDTLGNAAPYSVLTQTNPAVGSPVVITDSSTTSYNVAAKFTATDSRYAVSKNSSGQLELVVPAHTHDGITFTAWTDTTSLPYSGNYYLDTDVTLSVWLDTSANLNLCLNGHTITYDGLPIRVRSGGTLGIYDCQGNGAVMATVSSASCIRIFSGGTVDIYGGTFNSVDRAAICVEGTVTIKNANVFGANAVQIEGDGMATINDGIFESFSSYPTISLEPRSTGIITGGTFIQNDGTNIIQNQGTLEMSGGTVTGRSSSTTGVSVSGILNYGASATATIKNVTITTVGTVTDDDTKADKGLRNDNGGTMTVENCDINSSNWAVWNTGGATIKISGGTFQGRYGMYNDNGTFELSGSPTFAGSTADIYLSNNQKITVIGTLGNAAPYSVLTQTNPTADSPVVITDSSTTSYNVAAKFTAADSRYAVRKNSDDHDQLELVLAYTIAYNAGSYGSGSVSSGTKAEGVDFTLTSDTFTRTGYTQTGWSKNSNGSTKDYALGEIYTDDASITLYPYWTANQYTVSFNSAGGSSVSTTMKVTYDSTYGNLPETTRAGYTFDGWYTAETGGTKVESNTKVTIADDHTLYAKWTEDTTPPKPDGGSSSGGGGSTGGSGGGFSSGSGNGSQSSGNNSGGSSSEDTSPDSVTPSTGTTPPKTDTVETVMSDADSNKEQKGPSGQKTDHEKDTASPVETKPVTEPQKEQTKDTQTDTTALTVGEGTVSVTVVSDGYQYAAGVTDTEAVANAVLTPEQIQLVSGGESIEIRVEVTDISSQVSQEDKDIIEGGLADNKITGDIDGREQGELILGAYIDISMYIKIGDGDWDAITQAGEPIEVVIGIPDNLLSDERTYYIARSHEGDFTLLNDLDSEPDTITIKTELFSTYAIVFRQTEGAGSRCKLCHICPTFLGICYFVWAAIIIVAIGVAIFVVLGKRRKEEEAAS